MYMRAKALKYILAVVTLLLSMNVLGWIATPEVVEEFWQVKPQDDKTRRAQAAAARRQNAPNRQGPASFNGQGAAGQGSQNAGNPPRNTRGKGKNAKNDSLLALTQLIIDEEEIPDSLLHPRWPVQPTTA